MSLDRIRLHLVGCLLAVGIVGLAACSSGEDPGPSSQQNAPASSEFPPVNGKTLVAFAKSVGLTNDLVVSPAGQTYEPGKSRFGFGVFNPDASEINDADIALYAAHGPDGEARGPFPARIESLKTEPSFASETAAGETVTVAYVSDMTFNKPGEWRIVAVVKQADGVVASLLPSIKVGSYPGIPDVGDAAPRIHTPTVEDVGDISKIDTRQPPDTMHDTDLYDVLGKQPVVLLFATPALCQSRVCGPMVDIAEQVHSETPDDVAFIHMEVYNDNDPNKGIRPELQAYGLQTEPWLFVMDSGGKVSTRIEGAFSVDDLETSVQKVRSGAS